MTTRPMYAPQKDSPNTFIIEDITATDTSIPVANITIFESLTVPFPLTLGYDKKTTETVIVMSMDTANAILTVIRGENALPWVTATKIARVFNASDLLTVQQNLQDVINQSNANTDNMETVQDDIENLETVVGDANSGLVQGLNNEISRAQQEESNLDTNKINRSELPKITVDLDYTADGNGLNVTFTYYNASTQTSSSTTKTIPIVTNTTAGIMPYADHVAVTNLSTNAVVRSELTSVITDWSQPSQNGTAMNVTITRYNANTKTTDTFVRTIPLVSDDVVGLMTPEAYQEISDLRTDVNALQNQGGKFIGVSFATKAALDAYTIPSTTNVGDFTYVLDDETHGDATTRYIYNGTAFVFGFVVNYDPIGIATSTTAGIVKSDGGTTNGKVFVETDGTMSVIGWDNVVTTSSVTTNSYGVSNTGNYISALTQTSTASGSAGNGDTGSSGTADTGSAGGFTPAGTIGNSDVLTSSSTTPGATGSTTPGATGGTALTSDSTTPGDTGAPSATTTVLVGSLSGTTLTITTTTVGSSAHTHTSAAHTHTIASHTHTSAAHTHTSTAHTHAVPAHAHSFTGTAVNGHTHTGPAHTHTGPSHTHTYDRTTGTSTALTKQTVVTGVT